ncbi:putative bifunctional diguanylate cyclase/phosphodiesterase [Catellatospora paridis]|uniref:putative bifunctional diguanylate cyclase/phosphodiesterase n=1 Tax=Catellatospora paridis TaxID=1617086 RepID=UPI0012D4B4E2|nr:EAL domain-containing protein [Catellatospora paridis]
MDLPPGLAIAVLASVLTAVPVVWALATNRLVDQHGLVVRANRLSAGALMVFALAAPIAWVHTAGWPDGWVDRMSSRMVLGGLLGLPASIAALLLVAALLEITDQVVGDGARLRLMLESLMVASGLFIVAWTFVLAPEKPGGHHALPGACVPVLVATVLCCAVLGLSAVLVVRAQLRRGPLLRHCIGAGLMAVGMTTIAGGACYGAPLVVLVGAAAVPTGAALWFIGPPPPPRASDSESVSPSSGLAAGLAPVVTISLVVVLGYSRGMGIEPVTALVGIVNGLFMVGRQYLAVVDVRRANNRLADSESHFRELAHTDPLTGLANRRGLLRTMYLDAAGGPPCVLLTLDLDGFKNVNDMRGHDAGDAVLIEVGQRLRLNLRPGDLAARLGGDEFAVLMWSRPGEAGKVATRLLSVLSRPYHHGAADIFLSASIGLAGCGAADDIPTLLRNADLALRAAKQRGKNRVELYDEVYDKQLRRRTAIEHELRGAIERQELSLAYQPVVALPSTRPVGAEALIRWNHPELGAVGPLEFIPIAEETGQIEVLGAWVLDQACRQLSRWVQEGYDVWVSVNISPRELHSTKYVTGVKEVLRKHRVPPSRLVLEVTEHAVATDLDEFRRTLAALRALGLRIALDDFGAGYSSLGQLRQMPVDILKIDRDLVIDAPSDHGPGAPMVDVAVRLGQRLGLQVIAEGISEPHHRRLVEATGCPYGQGQLFGMGVPAEHLEARLASSNGGPKALPAAPTRPLPSTTSAGNGAPPTKMLPSTQTAPGNGVSPAKSLPLGQPLNGLSPVRAGETSGSSAARHDTVVPTSGSS